MKVSKGVLKHRGLSWFSDEHKIIYLGIPKTASTSMRHTFKIDRNIMNMNNVPIGKEHYRKFTVIREPFKRFVSGVYESFSRPETPKKLKELESIPAKAEMLDKYLTILETEGFSETHTTPQSFFFCNNEDSEFKFSKVLIFENIEKEFNSMCSEYGINKTLKHEQKGKKGLAAEALVELNNNPDLKKRVEVLYKKDFDLYNKYKTK